MHDTLNELRVPSATSRRRHFAFVEFGGNATDRITVAL
jgi:hypothetical protein